MSNSVHLGLDGIIANETRLTFIDGEKGRLVIAGFELENIAPNATFEELLYLLYNDKLANKEELMEFSQLIKSKRNLPLTTINLLREIAKAKLPVIDALRIACGTLTLLDRDPKRYDYEINKERSLILIANFPIIVAYYYRFLQGLDIVKPNEKLNHVENFLYMLSGEIPNKTKVRALETYLNTVVDHGSNASSFTGRVIISTLSDMISAVTGAIGALKGPIHGGAPGPALDMIFKIGKPANTSLFIKEELKKGEKIMGFGHRVYKTRDPRAEVLSRAAEDLFKQSKDKIEFYENVKKIEFEILKELKLFKPNRKIETNVEFYTSLVLYGLELPNDLFTACFAIGRVGGWTAQALEHLEKNRLIRPKEKYIGEFNRKWVPVDLR